MFKIPIRGYYTTKTTVLSIFRAKKMRQLMLPQNFYLYIGPYFLHAA